MRRKRLFTALVSILMIFVFAGCSNSNNSGQASAASNNGNGNFANGNRPAFQKPDVYGEVSAISGNKVTLKLLKIPQMMGRNRQGGRNGGGNSWSNGNGNGGGNGTGTGGGNRGFGGGMRAKQYTGEVKTIDIPSGVTLTTMTRGQNGMTQSNISLNQVPTGSVFSIYYDTDGKTIKSIRVQQPRMGNGQQGGNSGNGQQSGNTGN